jgi:hypothetical protein
MKCRCLGTLLLDTEYGCGIVGDALNEQERSASKGGCHDVRGARLTTLDGRLTLVVVGLFVVVAACDDGE